MSASFFNKVLIAVDDSEQSARAVDLGVKMAGSSIIGSAILFNIYDSGSIDVTKLHSAEKLDKLRTASLDLLHKYEKLFTAQGLDCQIKSAGGDPAELIMDLIHDSGNFDLIIIGSRRLNKFQEITMRSVSDKVTRLVTVPVLIVK